MTWDIEMAKMFKKRNNPNRIGAIIGKVVRTNPLQISILDGNVILDKRQLYITYGLLEKSYKFNLEAKGKVGNITTKLATEETKTLVNINIIEDNKDKTKIKLYFELKEDDEVLLIPSENERIFFIIDKVKKGGD